MDASILNSTFLFLKFVQLIFFFSSLFFNDFFSFLKHQGLKCKINKVMDRYAKILINMDKKKTLGTGIFKNTP